MVIILEVKNLYDIIKYKQKQIEILTGEIISYKKQLTEKANKDLEDFKNINVLDFTIHGIEVLDMDVGYKHKEFTLIINNFNIQYKVFIPLKVEIINDKNINNYNKIKIWKMKLDNFEYVLDEENYVNSVDEVVKYLLPFQK